MTAGPLSPRDQPEATASPPAESMPDNLSPRHLARRLLELAGLVAVVAVLILFGPDLGSLRHQLAHASPGWLIAACVLEVLSALSYVVIFRAVFCPRMSWRLSYQIGMAEQAANSLLPAGGAGGLALGVWALRRGGMSAEHIGRRTVAFFILTSLANFVTLIAFAFLFAVGILRGDRTPTVTYGFAIAAVLAIVITLMLPRLVARSAQRSIGSIQPVGRVRAGARTVRDSIGNGVLDSVMLVRERPVGVLVGSFGYMGFDIAALGACFLALGHAPALGILVLAYLIGQLGGLLPIPGGIGGTEGGLIGTFALYHVPLATATAAVLAYRAIELWIPAVLGSVAFVRLRASLEHTKQPAVMCEPLADPIESTYAAAGAG
jgi:uncharacterized protein (TIRG00374 family)